MNKEYKEQYDKLVSDVKKKRRGIKRLKNHGRDYNIHHIDPRSLGGSDKPSNLIKFTHEEHFEAHRLLYLMYKGTNGRREYRMAAAFMAMSMNEKFTSRDYSEAKKSMFDIGMSDKTRRKIAKTMKGKPRSIEAKESMSRGSAESNCKISIEDLPKILDEITRMVLDGVGSQKVDEILSKKYNVSERSIRNYRQRRGFRLINFPQTLTKGQFDAARVNQRRINMLGVPMTKEELVDWANKVDGKVESNNPSKKTKKMEGVSWCEDNKKWKAEIIIDKVYGLGYYDSETSACMAVNRAIDRGKNKKTIKKPIKIKESKSRKVKRPLTRDEIQHRADVRAGLKKK